ncbi:MAG TPA: hypothetical protein ACHBZ9_08915, partial [Arsenophonus nasoniae]|uniref:hypothetical protein n=1 Tax=Arsenophonus nasoniae TaxID=638 RepID=UPI00387A6505
NHVYNFMMATTLNGENVTFSNLDRLTQTGSTTAGIAGWMMMSIPFLSFKLFTSLGQQIASAGSYLGNALAGATTADASAVASGNYNMANMQVENINGFKTDLNRSFKAGLSSQQIDNGSMISTTQSGQHIVDTTQAISKLPFSLDTSSMLDTSFSKALSSQHRETESYHQGLKSAISDTYNISTALSNQFNKQGSFESGLTGEQRQAIEDIQRQSQQAKSSLSSNNSTSREDKTSTDRTDIGGFGVSGSFGVSNKNMGGVANANANLEASYRHQWVDTNTDSASKSNKTSEDLQVARDFSASQSASVIRNMTDNDVSRISNAETRSLVRDLRASLQNTSENFAGFTASQTKEQTISEQANLTETERLTASHRLEQEFTQFAYSRLGEAEANHVLTDAGSPTVRAQREALVSEFSDRIADDIRHNHFATQAVVTSHYQGIQVSHDASQYNPAGFNQSVAQLEKQADRGQIRQQQIIVNPETGERNTVSLVESAEANTGEYAKAIRAEKTDFGHNVALTQDKIMANEKAINKEKSTNINRYEEKGGQMKFLTFIIMIITLESLCLFFFKQTFSMITMSIIAISGFFCFTATRWKNSQKIVKIVVSFFYVFGSSLILIKEYLDITLSHDGVFTNELFVTPIIISTLVILFLFISLNIKNPNYKVNDNAFSHNPANGLPMVGGTDISGNMYGACSKSDD